jgi:hypothetical protein
MSLSDRIRGRSGDDEDRNEQELEAEQRGETSDLPSHKREVREQRGEEGHPSAGGGYTPPP